MRQASKFLELISKIALGIFILFILLGIYFAFYPKVKDREKYIKRFTYQTKEKSKIL